MPHPVYRVVISTEGRYSLWPAYKEIPWGWHADGTTGTKEDCLDYIAKTWTDMRPQSLRPHLKDAENDAEDSPSSISTSK